jgi:hypothetical protein
VARCNAGQAGCIGASYSAANKRAVVFEVVPLNLELLSATTVGPEETKAKANADLLPTG